MRHTRTRHGRTVMLLAAIMALALCCAPAALADTAASFTSDGIVYNVKDDSTVYVGTGLSGQSALADTGKTDVSIPESVDNDGRTYTVARISAYAFYGCKQLKSVTLPKTVTMIGSYAFAECGSMTGQKKSASYTGLTTLNLPADTQLAQINSNAFLRCYALKAFTFPKSVKVIGESAFESCYSFTQFKCESQSQLDSIGESAFRQELPAVDENALDKDGITKEEVEQLVGTSADSYGGVTSVSIPASVTKIGSYTFANQRDLTSITFEASSIPYLGTSMFAFCTSLEKAEIPTITGYQYRSDTMWALGQQTFSYCPKLTTFVFGGDVATSSGRYSGLDFFAGDFALSTVVYKGKECLPAYGWHAIIDAGSVVDQPIGDASSWYYGIPDSDPTLYYQVTFYASKADAEAGRSPIGSACVRKGTLLSSINSSLAASDNAGTLVWSGSIPSYASGCNAWAFEGDGSATTLQDSLHAYGVNSADLSYGTLDVPEKVVFTGEDATPHVSVADAQGNVVDASAYSLAWERKTAQGWTATSDLTSTGTLRCVATATGAGGYTGQVSKEFAIVKMSAGDSFACDGVTYVVTSAATSKTATVQVGDGKHLAVDSAFSGKLTIPATVSPAGSKVRFKVTAIAPYAFGAKSSDGACAGITAINLPTSVNRIGMYAFANCAALQSATAAGSLSAIDTAAFYNCRSLKALQLKGSKIDSIAANAFARCTALCELSLPAVNRFEGNAFANCARLKAITFRGSVKAKPTTQFSGCQSVASVVYRGANWGYSFGAGCTAYRIVSASKKTCSLAYCAAKSSVLTVPAAVKITGKSYKLVGIDARAFAKSSCKTVKIVGKGMTSFKGAFTASKVSTVKVPASKKTAYKKLLSKSACGKAVAVR